MSVHAATEICKWSCSVVVWNLAKKEAVCGSPAQAPSSGLTYAIAYSNTSDDVFVTGGKSVTYLRLSVCILCVFVLYCIVVVLL